MEWRGRKRFREKMVGVFLCFGFALIFFHPCGNVRAAERYPTRAVDLIVPFSAGAATDMLARFMADELSKRWKQPVNVINKPGGNTVIGTHAVMSATPDGYTILADSTGSSSAQLGMKGLPYQVLNRTFLAGVLIVPQAIVESADCPWQSLKELAEGGRKNPADMVWGAAAGGLGGGDMVLLQFFEAAGIDIPKTRKVDFPGGAAAVNALAGGHIKLKAGSPGAVDAVVSSGKGRALPSRRVNEVS